MNTDCKMEINRAGYLWIVRPIARFLMAVMLPTLALVTTFS